MKILYKHLQSFVNKNLDFTQTIKDLERLGLEVEGFAYYDFENVLVGKIIKIIKHPDADKLQIATINVGEKELEVVCGANNIKVEQLVPVALEGAQLNELTISKAKIRGVWSSGMLCSARELGLSDNHQGILILESSCQIGKTILDYFADTSYIDVNITPNRPDWYSALGVARELAAYHHLPLPKLVSKLDLQYQSGPKSMNEKIFSSYSLVRLSNISKLDTPQEIIDDLRSLGLNPKGNLFIDITNWSTFVLGQPLHAFDANKIKGEIYVREAKDGEKLTLIDDNSITLSPSDTVISDQTGAIALAGIMGGQSTAIDEQTRDIFIEAASFVPKLIRASVVRHSIASDASQRFEKGVDPQLTTNTLNYIVQMISEYDRETKIDQAISVNNYTPSQISYEHKLLEQISATKIDRDVALGYLKQLGYQANQCLLTIPSWRFDISIPHDLAEDILRLHGFDKLAKNTLNEKSINSSASTFSHKLAIKQSLVQNGFFEIQSLSFISAKEAQLLEVDQSKLQALKNPTSHETAYLRPNLLLGLIKTIKQNPAFKSHLIFEIGMVFSENKNSKEILTIAATANQLSTLQSSAKQLGLDEHAIKEVPSSVLSYFKIHGQKVYCLEQKITEIKHGLQFDKHSVMPLKEIITFSNLSPSVKDVSFWLDEVSQLPEIVEAIYKQDPAILVVEQFDHYHDSKSGRTAVGLRIVLDPLKGAFTEENISDILNKIVSYLTKKGLELR